jgi:hypothetical protein
LWFEASPGQIVHKTLSGKKPNTYRKKRAGGVVQGVGLEFKPQKRKKKHQNVIET